MSIKLKNLGQHVFAFDPMDELGKIGLGHLRARCNPLAGLDPSMPDYVERIGMVAAANIMAAAGEQVSFWNGGSHIILCGVIDYVVKSDTIPPEEKHLGTVRDLLIDPDGVPLEAMADLGGMAKAAAALLGQASDDARGDLMATAIGHTKWLDSSGMRGMLSGSDIDLADLCDGNVTIFLILPPQYLEEHARFLRLFVSLATAAATAKRPPKHPTLMILDETYAIGPLAVLVRAMGIMAGYGLRIWTVLQGLTQLQELYPKNYQTFLANCGQNQVFATNDMTTMGHFADRLGSTMRFRKVRTEEGYEWEAGPSNLLRTGDELARSTSRDSGRQMVFVEGGDTFLLRRSHYDDLFRKGSYSVDPHEQHRVISPWRRLRDARDTALTAIEWAIEKVQS